MKFGEQSRFTEDKRSINRVFGAVPQGLYKEQELRFERRSRAPVEQTIKISKVFIHPKYKLNFYYDDIALVLLEEPVSFLF